MQHELMKLPYAYTALEPYMSEETLTYHHDKHHGGYVSKLNTLIAGTEFESMKLEQIITHAKGAVFNNAAQMFNHDFFWNGLSPAPTKPSVELETAIVQQYGSTEAFKKAFDEQALALFGSGWVWLVVDKNEWNKLCACIFAFRINKHESFT